MTYFKRVPRFTDLVPNYSTYERASPESTQNIFRCPSSSVQFKYQSWFFIWWYAKQVQHDKDRHMWPCTTFPVVRPVVRPFRTSPGAPLPSSRARVSNGTPTHTPNSTARVRRKGRQIPRPNVARLNAWELRTALMNATHIKRSAGAAGKERRSYNITQHVA
jgi:hypothetical protein